MEVYDGAVDLDFDSPNLADIQVGAGEAVTSCTTCSVGEAPTCRCMTIDPQYFVQDSVVTFEGSLVTSTDAGSYDNCRDLSFAVGAALTGPRSLTMDGQRTYFATDPPVVAYAGCTGVTYAQFNPNSNNPLAVRHSFVINPRAGGDVLDVTSEVRGAGYITGLCTVHHQRIGMLENPYPDAGPVDIDASVAH